MVVVMCEVNCDLAEGNDTMLCLLVIYFLTGPDYLLDTGDSLLPSAKISGLYLTHLTESNRRLSSMC